MTPHAKQRPAPPPLAQRLGGERPYLVGIGGCGLSALARLLTAAGLSVRGSDPVDSPTARVLATDGVTIDRRQTADALPEDADVVIASAAVKPDNDQLVEAVRRGLPVLTYAEALGRCMEGRTGVSIAGTHGKSTTAAMLGCVLTDAGLDPSVIIGATCGQLAGGALAEGPRRELTGFRLGGPEIPAGSLAGGPGLLVAEACEFNRSFHHHRPRLASIANVEADHLDVYGTLDAVVEAFAGFAGLLPPASEGGRLLIGHDGAHRREITAGVACAVETIGFAPASDWRITHDPAAGTCALEGPDGLRCGWRAQVPGEHNAMNAAVAAALALGLGADPEVVGRSLSAFAGLSRRLELLGARHDGGGAIRVYDDYGHHPTEIDATLRALRQHEQPQDRGGRLVVVFQPHQHSRTRFLLEEFATSFSQADIVIVPHIYFVRDSETERQRVSSADLVDALRRRGVRAMHLYPFEAIVEQLENVCRAGDLLVVMGAGPVWQVGREYLRAGNTPGESADSSAPRDARAPAAHAKLEVERGASIRTWFGVGGNADRLCRPGSIEAFRRALDLEPGARVLGDGANLLVHDDGVGELVIDLSHEMFSEVEIDGDRGVVRVGAGKRLPKLIPEVIDAGLGGLEGLAGIPASIGGAARMNAGGRFGSIGDVVRSVTVLTREGVVETLPRSSIDFGYRRGGLGERVIIGVEFELGHGERADLKRRYREALDYKNRSQPKMTDKSAGCCFKNPVLADAIEGIGHAGERVSAGLLLDLAGCKGRRVGSATISERHANFITVAKGGRAADVVALMEQASARVADRFGVTLEREVVVWGRERTA